MAQRYGRKRKQAHLAKIAELEEALEQARLVPYGHLGLSTQSRIPELPLAAITRLVETSVTEPGYKYDHTLEVTVQAGRRADHAVIEDICLHGEFRLGGIHYIVKNCGRPVHDIFGDNPQLSEFPTIEIEAVGVRGDLIAEEFQHG